MKRQPEGWLTTHKTNGIQLQSLLFQVWLFFEPTKSNCRRQQTTFLSSFLLQLLFSSSPLSSNCRPLFRFSLFLSLSGSRPSQLTVAQLGWQKEVSKRKKDKILSAEVGLIEREKRERSYLAVDLFDLPDVICPLLAQVNCCLRVTPPPSIINRLPF